MTQASRPYLEFLDFMGKVPSGNLLDLGSGRGTNSLALARLGFSVLSVDSDEHNLEELQERAEQEQLTIKTRQVDLNHIAFDEKFDVIVIDQILHFINDPDEFLACAASYVNPEGIFSVVYSEFEGDADMGVGEIASIINHREDKWEVLCEDVLLSYVEEIDEDETVNFRWFLAKLKI